MPPDPGSLDPLDSPKYPKWCLPFAVFVINFSYFSSRIRATCPPISSLIWASKYVAKNTICAGFRYSVPSILPLLLSVVIVLSVYICTFIVYLRTLSVPQPVQRRMVVL